MLEPKISEATLTLSRFHGSKCVKKGTFCFQYKVFFLFYIYFILSCFTIYSTVLVELLNWIFRQRDPIFSQTMAQLYVLYSFVHVLCSRIVTNLYSLFIVKCHLWQVKLNFCSLFYLLFCHGSN